MNQPLPDEMRAMLFSAPGQPLFLKQVAVPRAGAGELLIKVHACGICRTDLHILDGDLPLRKSPLILGHEIAGEVVACGAGVNTFAPGERVGVPWLGRTCGVCEYCRSGQENLCDAPEFTGYTRDGGFAEYTLADQRYCFKLPENFSDPAAAPLLCAGLIGFRTLRMAGDGAQRLGIYGFGAAAHIIAQIAVQQGKEVFAFTRSGDVEGQAFARQLGAVWAGSSTELPPHKLDAGLIFAPVGALLPAALQAVRKGGKVVCGGIHMSDIPSFPYRLLWEERQVCSVANLTREDGEGLFAAVAQAHVTTRVTCFPLEAANQAIAELRSGSIQGAAVLVP